MKASAEDVLIRKLRAEDAEFMSEMANNFNVFINLRDALPHPYTIEHARDFINTCKNHSPTRVFAIEFKGKYVGNIGITPGDDVYRKSAEVGYFIGESYWNKGIASRALMKILDYGFNELGVIRVFTGVFGYNHASMRVLEKCGFKKEGIFEKAVIKNDHLCDEHRYAILNPNYKTTL